MALMSFFKKPQHQRFEYNPRHYDPKKEDLETRLRLARNVKEGDPNALRSRISSGLRRKHIRQQGTGNTNLLNTNIRLIAIIVILFGMTYVFLTIYLPEIVKMVE
ncbi:MAG: hypothetical protein ACI8YQ_002736 [Polaribacter sp.]|jgi:hypothetical protein